MPQVDREALRETARAFLGSPDFMRHYRKLHVSARGWGLACLFLCLTIIGIPRAVRAMLKTRNQKFASAKLLNRYQQLADAGRVVQGFVLLNNSSLTGNPKACAPALVIASVTATDAGDVIARELSGKIVDELFLKEPDGAVNIAVQAMIDDDEYRAFRKRRLPAEFTGGTEAHFLDVMIDNELLSRNSLYGASNFYFLVDPSPDGLILQIPQVASATPPLPPPLPTPA